MAKEENANYKGDAEDSTSIQPAMDLQRLKKLTRYKREREVKK